MTATVDWEVARLAERERVLSSCAEFLRARGIPCGAWSVPGPAEIKPAQAAFDAELERIIEDMMIEVPRLADAKR
jgi:hypothetical protein